MTSVEAYVIKQYPYLAKPENKKMLGIVVNITEMSGPAEFRVAYQPTGRKQENGQAKMNNAIRAGGLGVVKEREAV